MLREAGMMGMTDEQYIEVAEEVWGWTWELSAFNEQVWKNEKGSHAFIYDDPNYSDGIRTSDLHEIVNSWSGFGRSLEAMAERKYLFGLEYIEENQRDDLAFADVSQSLVFPIIWPADKPQLLIEATHLAALEAVKRRKE